MLVPNAWCPLCGTTAASWAPGPGGRPDATCRGCGSLERHRLVAMVFEWLAPLLRSGRVVEAAPTPAVQGLLLDVVGRERYLSFDLGLDNRTIDVRADLTQLPFPDASIDVLVCFHILEHVPDDRAAMAEIARVLPEHGVALVMNPWVRDKRTAEDPDASAEERTRRFGQEDHVRLYGTDFEQRLADVGLDVHRFEPTMRLPVDLVVRTNLSEEPLWLLTRAGDAGRDVRRRLEELLPPDASSLPALEAAADGPVLVAARDRAAVARGAELLGSLPGLALAHDVGVLERHHQLVAAVRDAAGDRRRFARRQLRDQAQSVRAHLGAADANRWGEALPGLTSRAGRRLVEDVLAGSPEAQVVHLVDPDQPWDRGDAELRRLTRRAGPRRYLRVDPQQPDAARAHVADFLGLPAS